MNVPNGKSKGYVRICPIQYGFQQRCVLDPTYVVYTCSPDSRRLEPTHFKGRLLAVLVHGCGDRDRVRRTV